MSPGVGAKHFDCTLQFPAVLGNKKLNVVKENWHLFIFSRVSQTFSFFLSFYFLTDWRAYIYSVGTECCSSSVFLGLLHLEGGKKKCVSAWMTLVLALGKSFPVMTRPIRSGATYYIEVVVSVSLGRLIDFHFAASQQYIYFFPSSSFSFHRRRNVFRCREEREILFARLPLVGTKRLFTRPRF